MKSLSIGSPFLSYIQGVNRSQYTRGESMSTMTPQGWQDLKEFAPQVFADRMKQPLGSRVTVTIYHSRETLAGFLAKTTFSIVTGGKPSANVIEFCWIKTCQLSRLEEKGYQVTKRTHYLREYLVSISPPTLRRVLNLRQDTLSDGLPPAQFPE